MRLTYQGAVLSKKNSKRIIHNPRTGKPMMVSNKAAKNNENDMISQFRAQTLGRAETIEKCEVKILIYEPNRQRRDLDNQATSILDALVGAEVIKDDSFKCVASIETQFAGVDKENPRAEIMITKI